jgi:hypothetical protein
LKRRDRYGGRQLTLLRMKTMNPKDYKVLFYSEDGKGFKLFIEGKEIATTDGIRITAGSGEAIEVSPNIVIVPGHEAICDIE